MINFKSAESVYLKQDTVPPAPDNSMVMELMKLLADKTISAIVVEHKDTLMRFGFEDALEAIHG